jgi:predicted dehydrogenase
MKVAVLGAGFGLYGYLPALISIGHAVVLPQRYRPTIEARQELAGFLDKIEWQDHDDAVLDRAGAVVLARRPDDQTALIPKILARPHLERIVLEKPLARNPDEAARLHAELAASGKTFRVGYTFPLTTWGQRLISDARAIASGDVRITWRFRAHHYAANAENWKRLHSHGGGALRFYGIQIIALLARLGYGKVVSSTIRSAAPDDVETWEAVLSGHDGARCHVSVESNADQRSFAIETALADACVSLDDPFSGPHGPQDRRVPLLAALCGDALDGNRRFHDWYEPTIALWQQIEQATTDRST